MPELADSLSTNLKLRVLIADDNSAFRDGLKRLLEAQSDYQVVAEAVDGIEAIDKALSYLPDVVILDYSMPRLDGISAASRIRATVPRVEILILTQHDAPYTVQRALEAGARGYVVKTDAGNDLLDAMAAIRQHKIFISKTISRALAQSSR